MNLWQLRKSENAGGYFIRRKTKFNGKERTIDSGVFYAKEEDAIRQRDYLNSKLIERFGWKEKK